MTRIGVVLILVAGSLAGATALAAAATKPTLRIADRTPVVVRGAGFAPGERVTVVLAAGSRWSRRASTTARGTFVVRFSVSVGRCARYTVQAFGSTGSRARLIPRITLGCVPGDGLIGNRQR